MLEGTETDAFEVAYPDMTVTIHFTNGCTLLVIPDPEVANEATAEEPIPDWTLFSPDGIWLGVGPGPVWRHQRADEPLP